MWPAMNKEQEANKALASWPIFLCKDYCQILENNDGKQRICQCQHQLALLFILT